MMQTFQNVYEWAVRSRRLRSVGGHDARVGSWGVQYDGFVSLSWSFDGVNLLMQLISAVLACSVKNIKVYEMCVIGAKHSHKTSRE